MKNYQNVFLAVTLLCFLSARASAASPVADLMKSMRQGTYAAQHNVNEFPKLKWSDIPDLLAYVNNANNITSFPVNPFSSIGKLTCTEGMVALWLIEGIRVGGKFPSHVPECYDKSKHVPPGALNYREADQKSVVVAYKEWWRKVKNMPEEQARGVDPFSGTSLKWSFGRIPKSETE